MRISDLFREAGTALFANRARSLLTVLGIVIGIGSVIAMTALIGGVTNSMMGSMGLDQARLVRIEAWSARGGLTDADIEQLMLNVPGYELVTGTTWYGDNVSTDTKTEQNQTFVCAHAVYLSATGVKVSAGRAFTEAEDEAAARVVVLNSDTATKLFGSAEEAVGQTVRIGNDGFTVVGICEAANSYDNSSYLPLTTAEQRFLSAGGGELSVIGIVEDEDAVEDVTARTEQFLSSYLGIDLESDWEDGYIYVMANKEIMAQVESAMATFQMLMVAVAGVSLLVGGIGIMNMMLTNVTERIREIGLRKALGARAADITRQFLLESVLICLAGGALGVLAGFGMALGITQLGGTLLAEQLGADGAIVPVVTLETVLWATGTCVAIGLVFGYYPARRAAKLNPVESLRFQ